MLIAAAFVALTVVVARLGTATPAAQQIAIAALSFSSSGQQQHIVRPFRMHYRLLVRSASLPDHPNAVQVKENGKPEAIERPYPVQGTTGSHQSVVSVLDS